MKKRKLIDIQLLKQPKGSLLCGVYCIKMIECYYRKPKKNDEEIQEKIVASSPNGRMYSATYKIGKYLNDLKLDTSIIKFVHLKPILQFCEAHQIPAIMNIHSFSKTEFGHFVVFVKFIDNAIIIRDPENKRTTINYSDMENSFKKKDEEDEVMGNIIILPVDVIQEKRECVCYKCDFVNIIDVNIINYVEALICLNCDSLINVTNQNVEQMDKDF